MHGNARHSNNFFVWLLGHEFLGKGTQGNPLILIPLNNDDSTENDLVIYSTCTSDAWKPGDGGGGSV